MNNIADLGSLWRWLSKQRRRNRRRGVYLSRRLAPLREISFTLLLNRPASPSFFGFTPDYTSAAASINGDDAIELFMNAAVVDVFGDINALPGGWSYLDGWAYRVDGTGQDSTTFTIGNWTFSGANALDGKSTNGTAATPFPLGSYSATSGGPAVDPVINEFSASTTGSPDVEYIEVFGDPNDRLLSLHSPRDRRQLQQGHY